MFNTQIFFNDLNMILLGFFMTCAGFMGYLTNPVANAILGLLAGVYGSWKYNNKKEGEPVTKTDLYEKYKNYQMPSAQDLASKLMDSNPELDPNLSPRAAAIYKKAYQRPNLRRAIIENRIVENPINLDEIRNSGQQPSNVVNLDDYRMSKRTVNSPKEVS